MFFLLFLWSNRSNGNLISGSSVFSKTRLNIWTFTVHILLKLGLENFECYFAAVRDECNCVVVWTFLGIAIIWDWNESWPVQVLWPLLSFPNLQHIEHSTLTASSFRIWNSSAGIPSPPLVLFIVMSPKATWHHTTGCLSLGEWSHHHGYLGHKDLFSIFLLCIGATSF